MLNAIGTLIARKTELARYLRNETNANIRVDIENEINEVQEAIELLRKARKLKPVAILSDDDGHNFIIPAELETRFFELMRLIYEEPDGAENYEAQNDLQNEFGKYATGGSINASGLQLFAEIK